MSFVFLFIPIVWWGIGDLGSTAALLLVLPDITSDGQEWDKNMSGTITLEQMREIFRIYKVGNLSLIYICVHNLLILDFKKQYIVEILI